MKSTWILSPVIEHRQNCILNRNFLSSQGQQVGLAQLFQTV